MFKQPAPKIQTTSLWDFPSQHYGLETQGSSEYTGVTPSYVIWNLLQRYTKPGDKVLDPMCGSGTSLDVCRDLRREGFGFDIAPSRPDIKKADARHLPLGDESIDFAFVDPPYSTHIRYSGDAQCIGELEARDGGYYEAMEVVIADIYRVLKDGAYFALYVSDSQAKGKAFCPIGFELFFRMSRLFEPVDIVCVTRHNRTLKRNHWHTSAIEGNYFLRGFNYLFIMRKNVRGDQALLKHEAAGMLSPLFQAAVKAEAGKVVTPEVFSQILDKKGPALEDAYLKKQEKKVARKTFEARRPVRSESRPNSRGDTPKRSSRPAAPKGGKSYGEARRPQR